MRAEVVPEPFFVLRALAVKPGADLGFFVEVFILDGVSLLVGGHGVLFGLGHRVPAVVGFDHHPRHRGGEDEGGQEDLDESPDHPSVAREVGEGIHPVGVRHEVVHGVLQLFRVCWLLVVKVGGFMRRNAHCRHYGQPI